MSLAESSDTKNLKKSDRTRLAILNAAAKLFKDRGYTATTLRDVADEANMKAGSIYYHFASKDEIMSEVLNTGLSAIHEAVATAINATSPEDHRKKLEVAISAHLKMLFEKGDYVSANIRLYSQLPESIRLQHQKLRHEYADLWEQLLQDARSHGIIRHDLEITPLRQFLLGALSWSIEWYDIDNYTVDEFAEKAIRLMGEGMYPR